MQATEIFGECVGALLQSVHRQGYRAPEIRRVYIPKPGIGRTRFAFRAHCAKRLGKSGLTLEPTKTKLVEFGRFAKRHASKHGRKRPATIYFPGFTLYCTRNLKGNFKVGMRAEKTRLRCYESTSEERIAGNPPAAFCGNQRRATASGDPMGRLKTVLADSCSSRNKPAAERPRQAARAGTGGRPARPAQAGCARYRIRCQR